MSNRRVLYLTAFPVAAVAGITIATTLSLADFDKFLLAWMVSVLLCATAAFLVMNHGRSTPWQFSLRDRFHFAFPTSAPRRLQGDTFKPEMTPEVWFEKVCMGSYVVAESALERQVTAEVDPSVSAAIMLALRPIIEGYRKGHWGVDELARRMWLSEGGATFDLAAYRRDMVLRFPKVNFDAKWRSESPFGIVRIAEEISFARKAGTVPAADFLWLRLVDRRLWHVVNGVGRCSYSVEAIGVFAHIEAQARQGLGSLCKPHVGGGLDALRLYNGDAGAEASPPSIISHNWHRPYNRRVDEVVTEGGLADR